jgi:tetratricopeptide (TPR) repeat protein
MSEGNGNGGSRAATRDPETDRDRLRSIHAALTGGDLAAAGKLAEDAFRDGIGHVMVLSLVAGRREEAGRLDEALALIERARAAAPAAPGIANQLGLVLLRMERWEAAAAAFGEAIALDRGFAPALANRGMALTALARLDAAAGDFEAAAALDPDNLVALDGLAGLALRRGEAEEARRLALQVLEREPGFPGATTILAEAELALGRPAEAEAAVRPLLGDARVAAPDRAIAWGLLGDSLDAQARFPEAFAAWRESNAVEELHYRPVFGTRPATHAFVDSLTAALAGRRIPAAFGHSGRSPARRHVFLTGFPRSGSELAERLLAGHPETSIMAGREGLLDAARDWMADAARFEAFLAADDDALEDARAAYWRRVGEAGVDPAGRVFVDHNVFNLFKLPLIARLFPDARVLIARRDPRDAVLAGFGARFAMSDPAWAMLTLEGTAALHRAAAAMVAASETAFGLFTHDIEAEALAADPQGGFAAICDFAGLARAEPPAAGLDDPDAGRWRHYRAEMAPVLPLLEP